jgi:predicted transposase YbfD/YdcC
METSPILALTQHFAQVDDPRVERTRLHRLIDILVIAICAVICGAESWDDIAEFGEVKQDWFATFLELPNGIPSHDTFNRVFAALNPEQFRQAFLDWMRTVLPVLASQAIALDGKTLRRSHDTWNQKPAIHLVSAWASATGLVLAQTKVDDKSNEITAIPDVLRTLAIKGCIVTIDAIGCQRAIAQQIVQAEGDYVLALKENQELLYEEVMDCFAQAEATDYEEVNHSWQEEASKGHGRIERRHHTVITAPDQLAWLQEEHAWPGLQAIGRVQAERRMGEERSSETRYYLLSRLMTAEQFGRAVRSHWGIENRVHWVLDVVFHEDLSRIRAGYAAENFAVLRHIALNLLKYEQSKPGQSIKGKRLKAGWDHGYLLKILASI